MIEFGKEKRWELINVLMKKRQNGAYLEIGCRGDMCFKRIKYTTNKTGVDPEKGGTIRKTSDEFFESNVNKFDVIFIDGDHTYAQVKKDVHNALEYLNEGGFIVLHDILPMVEERARDDKAPPKSGGWNGTVWKISFDLLAREDLRLLIGKFDDGCAVLQKQPNPSVLTFDFDAPSWENYIEMREDFPLYTFDELVKKLKKA